MLRDLLTFDKYTIAKKIALVNLMTRAIREM
jgi:hypothetical protein